MGNTIARILLPAPQGANRQPTNGLSNVATLASDLLNSASAFERNVLEPAEYFVDSIGNRPLYHDEYICKSHLGPILDFPRGRLMEIMDTLRWLQNEDNSLYNSLCFRVMQLKFKIISFCTDRIMETIRRHVEVAFIWTKLTTVVYMQDLNPKQCCICLENFHVGSYLQQCPQCENFFHDFCIYLNLREQFTCPTCRYDLV